MIEYRITLQPHNAHSIYFDWKVTARKRRGRWLVIASGTAVHDDAMDAALLAISHQYLNERRMTCTT